MSSRSDSTLRVIIYAGLIVIVVTCIIALAILIHHNQKLEACNKITDNAARIICISEQ